MANITVVGITDAGAASLLPEAQAAVAEARLLCGGERHLAFFPEHAAERVIIKGGLEQLYLRLEREERLTVVLASGDPDWYGIGPLLAERLGQKRVRILPNLSAVQPRLRSAGHRMAGCSVPKRPRAGPGGYPAPGAVRPQGRGTHRQRQHAGRHCASAVGCGGYEYPGRRLRAPGRAQGAPRLLLSGRDGQPGVRSPQPASADPHRKVGGCRWVCRDDLFAHQRGQITKAEVRAVSVSKLALHADAVVWDIGAGCGSVSIEIAGLASRGQVYAVERNTEQQDYLALNRRRFGAGNVSIVTGEAPDALAGLPEPDAVFIGGSGGRLDEVLTATTRALKPGGRVVLNLVGLEHVSRAFERLQTDGWSPEVAQLSVARSTSTAGITRLAALNPVFVISAHKR